MKKKKTLFFHFKYHFCGPGTKLTERLARGDQGINGLDRACKNHDIAYAKFSNGIERIRADAILGAQAKINALKTKSIGEKITSNSLAYAMLAKWLMAIKPTRGQV